jgi:homopolymeric O-antigen transport system ATP-binding protein
MTESAIQCRDIGKKYSLGERQRYQTLRESITNAFRAPFRMFGAAEERSEPPEFWALRNVSFDVAHGEILGIIGHNGAGKSTLLKVLSRITAPTEGEVEIAGRVGSLLEVGTGFHPELTGRENIYLNGSILGMRRKDITRRFDDIVAFAEVEKFIDTPVKRYSSGMYVRLAFAVAVHLEPEILIIDEVLAVGDAEFQKKCLNKIQEIGRGNRTILLVSHNMAAIRNICDRAMLLERGRIVELGDVNRTVDDYLSRIRTPGSDDVHVETPTFRIDTLDISSPSGPVVKTFEPFRIALTLTAKMDVAEPDVYVGILTMDGTLVSALVCRDFVSVSPLAAGATVTISFSVESLPLLPGEYQLEVRLVDVIGYKFEIVPRTFAFTIAETPIYGGRKIDAWYGSVALKATVSVSTERSLTAGALGR